MRKALLALVFALLICGSAFAQKTYAPAATGGENTSNKDTDATMAANSDSKYPSQKAAKAYADAGLAGKVTANNAITPGTKTKITYDAKGLVTLGADVDASDIPSGIDASKIGDGSVSTAEFQFLNSVSADIQAQINGKQSSLGFTPENIANKSTDGALAGNSDTLYPSQKAAKTYIDNGLAGKQASLGFMPLNILSGTSGSIGGSLLAAGACASGTVSITGATTSMAAVASPAGGADPSNGGILGVAIDARVSSSNIVTVSVCSPVAGTPAAATYNVRVIP